MNVFKWQLASLFETDCERNPSTPWNKDPESPIDISFPCRVSIGPKLRCQKSIFRSSIAMMLFQCYQKSSYDPQCPCSEHQYCLQRAPIDQHASPLGPPSTSFSRIPCTSHKSSC